MKAVWLALVLAACGVVDDLEVADAGAPPCKLGKACTDPCGRFSSPAACRASKDGGR